MSPSPLPLRQPSLAAVDTRSFFKLHWTCFKVLGIKASNSNTYYLGYSVLLQVLVTLCYPLHLVLALFSSPDASTNIQNLAVCVTCVVCSVKFIIYVSRMSRIRELESIIATMDARPQSLYERRYFMELRKEMRRITFCFLGIYGVVGVTAELMFIFRNEHTLLYPARLPFDWRATKFKFYLAHAYQIVGISHQLLQNFVNDCFPTVVLALLSAHIKLMGIRVSQIGANWCKLRRRVSKRMRKSCCVASKIRNSFIILRFRNIFIPSVLHVIQNIISLPMFLQFTVTAVNICLALNALLFFVDAPFDRLYYLAYLHSMPLEIFTICYYGTTFQLLFDKLHVELFSGNWVEQTHEFRKHMILFCERSLMSQTAMAGGIVRIHLNTFISTCKAAYSLLAVIMKMNE